MEQAAISSGRISSYELMELAGKKAASEIHRAFDEDRSVAKRAHILCGPGNNGGDGFIAAAALKQLGWKIDVWAMGSPNRMSADALSARSACEAIQRVRSLASISEADLTDGGVVVDAIFGVGLSRPVQGPAARALRLAESGGPLVAIDILSGLNSDNGQHSVEGLVNPKPASMTVSFECAKRGHFTGAGERLSGRVCIVSLGLAEECQSLVEGGAGLRLWSKCALPRERLDKRESQHKYNHGHALILSGSKNRGGAARLAARAALRIGAGLVTIGARSDALAEHAAQLNAVMLDEVNTPEDLRTVLTNRKINTLCVGPGFGTDEDARRLILACLTTRMGIVVDADALTAFEAAPDKLFNSLHCNAVLTPHSGEFSRLFPDSIDGDDFDSKVSAVRKASLRARSTVLLKGAHTLIADSQGRIAMVASSGGQSAAWLATAGSGDVLSGMICGLMARGLEAATAAGVAAWLHAETARRCGPGMISEDLPENLPEVLQDVLV